MAQTGHTGIEAAVAGEEQRQHWQLLDDNLKREWSALDPAAGLSRDVLTYATDNLGVLETGIKVRLLLSLLRVTDNELATLWQPIIKFLSASKHDSEPWVRSAMDIVVTRIAERNIPTTAAGDTSESIIDKSQLPLPSGTIQSAKEEVLGKIWESWQDEWNKRKPIRMVELKDEQEKRQIKSETNATVVAKANNADGYVATGKTTTAVTCVNTETVLAVKDAKKEAPASVTTIVEVKKNSDDAKLIKTTQNGVSSSQSKEAETSVASTAGSNGQGQGDGTTSKLDTPVTTSATVALSTSEPTTATTTVALPQSPVKKEDTQPAASTAPLANDTKATPATEDTTAIVTAKPLPTAATTAAATVAKPNGVVPMESEEEMYLVPPDFFPTEWLFMSQTLLLQHDHYDLEHSARNVHFTPLTMDKFTTELPAGAGTAPSANASNRNGMAARGAHTNGNGVNGGRMSRLVKPQQQQQLVKNKAPLLSAAEIMARREATKARKPTTGTTNKPIRGLVDHNEMERQRLLRQATRGSGRGSGRGGVRGGRVGAAGGPGAVKRRSGMMTRGGSTSAMRGSSKRVRGGFSRQMSTSSSLASPGSDSGSDYHHHQSQDPDRTPYASSEGSYPRPSPSPSPPLGSPVMASPGWSPGPESPSGSPQPMSPSNGGANVAANLLRGAKKMTVENRGVVEAFLAGEGNPTPAAGHERRILHSVKVTKTANAEVFLQETFYIVINYDTRKYRKIKQKKHIKMKRKQPGAGPTPSPPAASPPSS